MHQKITFYRICLNSYGDPYNSPLWSVRIPLSVSAESALHYAREEFASLFKILRWSDIAHFYQISC